VTPVAHSGCAAIILAAGASARMGRPKALLPFAGESFLDRLIGVYASHCDPVLVVLGHGAESISAGLERSAQAAFVLNPRPERGQLSSLQCALRLVPAQSGLILFTPVDAPAVQPGTIAALIAAWRGDPGAPLVAPRHTGRHGHPLGLSRALLAEFLALAPPATAREVVRRHRDATLYVDVADPGVLWDVDTPEDLAAHALGDRQA
jgi:molybdenum cofactor cytidylyltransferase